MENNKVEFSVIIPTYNEASKEKEMKEHLDAIEKYFEKIGKTYEVIIVLDGPSDETAFLVTDLIKGRLNFFAIDRKKNKGKGYSVREGFARANGEIRLFTDMDGATPIEMLGRFLPEFEKGADVVIGSRDLSESKIKKHQPKWKEWMGDFGNLLIQAGTGLWGMKDTQCGFKAFRAEVVREVFPRATVERWGLDFELLMMSKKLGHKIIEVPVDWIDKGDSLVGLSGYVSTFRDLAKVKWNMIKGVYQLDKKIEDVLKNNR